MKQNENEFFDKEYCLEIWGDWACFTRPELKVERMSYDVITPSAARNIFQAIFWKPAIEWQITRIEVINPIKWTNVRRNEVGATASTGVDGIFIEERRQQRNSLVLRDVKYRIHAKLKYISVGNRKIGEMKHKPTDDENPRKYQEMFERRARKGQCFTQPYLGTREFSASFRLIEDDEQNLERPINDSRDLGIMLYDMDFTNPKNITPMFFRAKMENGVIEVPQITSNEILR